MKRNERGGLKQRMKAKISCRDVAVQKRQKEAKISKRTQYCELLNLALVLEETGAGGRD